MCNNGLDRFGIMSSFLFCLFDLGGFKVARVGYIRVSSTDQNTSRQEEMFKELNLDKIFMEKVSGRNIKDRPELIKMMEYVREGDLVVVESISRFGRSLSDLLLLIDQLNQKGVQFKALKEGDIDTTTPTGYLFSLSLQV